MDISTITAAQTASTRATSQLTANFDTFLTLLTTQLRNQDPLAPLDTEKFTEQLVQFAGVEQSIQTNQHLEALLALQSSSNNETALAMVGRVATVESDVAALADGAAQWTYSLPRAAASAEAQIFDASGARVATFPAASGAGSHEISWNGALANGARAADGAYRLAVVATDAEEQTIAADVSTRGLVSAVSFASGAPEIEITGISFALDLVRRVDAAS